MIKSLNAKIEDVQKKVEPKNNFPVPVKERVRKYRQNKNNQFSELKEETEQLKKEIKEKDKIISSLKADISDLKSELKCCKFEAEFYKNERAK